MSQSITPGKSGLFVCLLVYQQPTLHYSRWISCSWLDFGLYRGMATIGEKKEPHLQSPGGTSADHSCPSAHTCFCPPPAEEKQWASICRASNNKRDLAGHVWSTYSEANIQDLARARGCSLHARCLIVMEGITSLLDCCLIISDSRQPLLLWRENWWWSSGIVLTEATARRPLSVMGISWFSSSWILNCSISGHSRRNVLGELSCRFLMF